MSEIERAATLKSFKAVAHAAWVTGGFTGVAAFSRFLEGRRQYEIAVKGQCSCGHQVGAAMYIDQVPLEDSVNGPSQEIRRASEQFESYAIEHIESHE